MVYNTPFTVQRSDVTGGAHCGIATFILNSIRVESNAGSPLGLWPIEGGAAGNMFILADEGSGKVLYMNKNSITHQVEVLSNNYLHLGNFYRSYRVKYAKMRISGTSLMPTSQTISASAPTDTPRTQNIVCSMIATDDLEAVDLLPDAHDYCRPFNRMHRYQKTCTFLRDGFSKPQSFALGASVHKLVRDRTSYTSADYTGAIAKGVDGGYPSYGDPVKKVYHSFVIHPYGYNGLDTANSSPKFNAGANLIGYLTCTKTVEFFNPHDNGEFYSQV